VEGEMIEFNPDEEYNRAMDRARTIDAIIALKPTFTREYLDEKNLDALHDLEDSLLDTLYETP